VYKVIEEDRNSKKPTFKVDSKISCLKYLDGRFFVGLKNGSLLIYGRDQGIDNLRIQLTDICRIISVYWLFNRRVLLSSAWDIDLYWTH
jgi:hypothetical protein